MHSFLSLGFASFALLSFLGCGGGSSNSNQNQTQTPLDTTTPTTLEDRAFTSTHFSGSDNCAACHNGISDEEGKDVSIESAWSATMMANSSKDPLWRAKVASEIARNPHLEEVINDKCTKCHAPMANKEAHYSQESIKVFDDGFLNSSNPHYDEAMNGVSCSVCHQIEDTQDLGELAGFSGNYSIGAQRIIYGQYNNVETAPMLEQVNYTPQQSDHISDSKMCATCHNLKTPYVDAQGVVLTDTPESEFPEQMPYTEWEHSSYAATQSCQACHMQRSDGVVIASRPPWLSTQRDNFAQHTFVGGNKLMLDILDKNKEILGVADADFETTLVESTKLLESAASISLENSSFSEGTLRVDLKITSTTGHKLPTSFPSRRAFVHFKLYDADNNLIFESGKVNSDGSIVGADSDADIYSYEPHYETISSQDQVQIYEAVMQNSDEEITYTLLRAASYKKDNRILPLGFDKESASSDIAVRGAAADDADFVGGSDSISYAISDLTQQNFRVEVELLYQTLAYPFAQDLFSDESAHSESFKGMFEASELKTSTIATLNQTVSLQ